MSTVRYVGHGVEIEDDVIRLRRHMTEFHDDAARFVGRSNPRRREARGPVSVMSAIIARWRSVA